MHKLRDLYVDVSLVLDAGCVCVSKGLRFAVA
jgi:hypothetical protein